MLLYFSQDSMIFPAIKLKKEYTYHYFSQFEEINIPVGDNTSLNSLLFKADNSKGLIFYLHGNGGNLSTWGGIAQTYTDLGYDIFIPDYRGYGKSERHIESEDQFLKDIQAAYEEALKKYDEEDITIIGYSIGTGAAAKLASENNPKRLILKAPYYQLSEVVHNRVPFMPDFLLKYRFKTYRFLEKVKCPVYIFHGTKDKIITYNNSERLKELYPEKKC